MSIELTHEEKERIIEKIQDYFRDELDLELGNIDAHFLLDFISREIGPQFYNRALHDARTALQRRMDDLTEALYELEQRTDLRR